MLLVIGKVEQLIRQNLNGPEVCQRKKTNLNTKGMTKTHSNLLVSLRLLLT